MGIQFERDSYNEEIDDSLKSDICNGLQNNSLDLFIFFHT